MIENYKKCNNKNCGHPIKLKTEFFKDSTRHDKLSPQCKDCKKGINKKYVENNIDKVSNYHKSYFQENKEYLMELDRLWKLSNPEKTKAIQNNYTSRNLDKRCANSAIRRARLKRVLPIWANSKLIKEIYKESRDLTQSTGIMHHVDHIIPLNGKLVSGLHVETNLQILVASENLQKNNKFEIGDDYDYCFNYDEILEILSDEDIV